MSNQICSVNLLLFTYRDFPWKCRKPISLFFRFENINLNSEQNVADEFFYSFFISYIKSLKIVLLVVAITIIKTYNLAHQ